MFGPLPRLRAVTSAAVLLLSSAIASAQTAKPRIVIVATGGTIAGSRRVHDRCRIPVRRGRRRCPDRRRAADEDVRRRPRRAGVVASAART